MQLTGKDSSSDNIHNGETGFKFAHAACQYCFTSSTGSTWIMDSGATDHMCCDLFLFDSYNDTTGSNNFITIPDGKTVLVTKVGSVHISKELILRDTLYVPEFKFNLISIHKLCKDLQCSVTFTNTECFHQGPSMRPQLFGNFKHGLYYLKDDMASAYSTTPLPQSSTVNNAISS